MTTALEMVKALAAKLAFSVQGDAIFALGARCMTDTDMNECLMRATSCEDQGGFLAVTTVDTWGDEMFVAVRISPVATIISIGPAR